MVIILDHLKNLYKQKRAELYYMKIVKLNGKLNFGKSHIVDVGEALVYYDSIKDVKNYKSIFTDEFSISWASIIFKSKEQCNVKDEKREAKLYYSEEKNLKGVIMK